MKLRQILFYRPSEHARTVKSLALRYLAGFVGVMLLCTLLSRAASAATMPQVTVEKPSRSAVSHVARAEGTLEAGAQTLVTATEGILVDSINASEGTTVAEGDPIFTLNADSLAKKIRTETFALQKLQIEQSVQQQNSQLTDKREQLAYERAYEDYSNAFDRSYKSVEDARMARAEALNAVRSYYSQHKDVIDRWNNSSLPSGSSSLDDQAIVAHYNALQSEYDAADVVYEAARDSRGDSWRDAERSMEDAQLALDANVDRQGEIMGLTIAMQAEIVKELERLKKDGGVIRSPIDGVVSRLLVEAGNITPANAAALVARLDEGYRFVAEFEKDDLKYLEQGGIALLSLPAGQPLQVTVAAIQNRTVTALLPQGKGELGARAVLEVTHKSETYPTCVPMSALRSDGNQKYVMVLREQETVLGTQLSAERVDVQVQDSNETRAAVLGGLQDNDKVVVSGTKNIRAGDRVRLMAQ